MRITLVVAALLVALLSTAAQQPSELTQSQKNQIKAEIKAVLDSMFARAERLDADAAFELYAPELVVSRDSALLDFQSYKKLWKVTFQNLTQWKWTLYHEHFIFISKDVVVCPTVGKVELVFKSGDRVLVNPQGYTDVFKKIDGRWLAIYETAFGTPKRLNPITK
jgi:hypothetical protein